MLALFFSGKHVPVKMLNMIFTSIRASWIDHGKNLWNLRVTIYRWKEGGNKEKWRRGAYLYMEGNTAGGGRTVN